MVIYSKVKTSQEKFCYAKKALEEIYLKAPTKDRAYVDATIRRFTFAFELSWKFLKDYFELQGLNLNFPKAIIQEAFSSRLIENEDAWIQMLQDRNLSSHSYDKKLADDIYGRIKGYVPLFQKLLEKVSLVEN